jgi:hypothetical protein
VLELDRQAAQDEVRRIQSFQALDDPRPQIRGGFYFGSRRREMLPYANPVSTAFCLQALEFWNRHDSGRWAFDLRQLI